jgi:hypothetical protein
MKDLTPCVVLCRDKPGREWELAYYTERLSHAWRLQVWIDEQERVTNRRHQTITALREDYDRGTIKVLRVPNDFDPAKVPPAASFTPKKVPPVAPPAAPPPPDTPPVKELDEFVMPLDLGIE